MISVPKVYFFSFIYDDSQEFRLLYKFKSLLLTPRPKASNFRIPSVLSAFLDFYPTECRLSRSKKHAFTGVEWLCRMLLWLDVSHCWASVTYLPSHGWIKTHHRPSMLFQQREYFSASS